LNGLRANHKFDGDGLVAEKDINDLLIAWATEIQALTPENVGGPAVLEAFAGLNELARDAAQSLPFESEPADFVRMLEAYARPSIDDD
jgi:hypothetical protein